MCKPCRKEYSKERRQKFSDFLNNLKGDPCIDCGGSFPPYVMDFDHVKGTKRCNVAGMAGCSLETIIEEITKCEVVCSNCHRIRTHKRKHLTFMV